MNPSSVSGQKNAVEFQDNFENPLTMTKKDCQASCQTESSISGHLGQALSGQEVHSAMSMP